MLIWWAWCIVSAVFAVGGGVNRREENIGGEKCEEEEEEEYSQEGMEATCRALCDGKRKT